jgi:hypothetical protein
VQPEVTKKARLMLELTRQGWGQENNAFMQVWSSTFQPGGSLDYLHSWAEQMRLATTAEKAVRLLEIGWSADVCEAARVGGTVRLSEIAVFTFITVRNYVGCLTIRQEFVA